MQSRFLGPLWPLCRAFGPNAVGSKSAAKVQKQIEALSFSPTASLLLTQLIDHTSQDEWTNVRNFTKYNLICLF